MANTLKSIALAWGRGDIDDNRASELAEKIPRYQQITPDDQYEDDSVDTALPGNSYDDVLLLVAENKLTLDQADAFINMVSKVR